MSEHTSEPDDILLLTASRGGGGRTVNQWDQNAPKKPVEQLVVATEYSGDGGLIVVDKDNFIRVTNPGQYRGKCPNLIGAVATHQGGVVGAETIVVLIGNGRQISVALEHAKKMPFCKRGRTTFGGRDRRCTLRFYSDGENGTWSAQWLGPRKGDRW